MLKSIGLKPLVSRYRDHDIRQWPAWLGAACDIKLPRRTVPHLQPAPNGSANINIIFELVNRTSAVDGDIAECGVFRGETLIPIALYAGQRNLSKHVWGLDSFEGFGRQIAADLPMGGAPDATKTTTGFSRTSLSYVSKKIQIFELESQVTLRKGYFQDSLPSLSGRRFSFVHLDCDLYESYRLCLEFFYPRMSKGGIILLDEYNDPPWPGCNKAADEFLADKPERLTEIMRDNYLKYYICTR